MFDIHIFTLYSLNQTILKKAEKRGKGKGHSSHGTNATSHAVGVAAEREHAEDVWTRQTNNDSSHTGLGFFFFGGIFNFLPVP